MNNGTDETKFVKVGRYWAFSLWKKIYLNIVYWFKGFWFFLKVMADYQESVIGNEMDIRQAWSLCFSIQEARMGKTFRMDIQKKENKEVKK